MAIPPGTNFYFNNFTNSQEQNLIEELVIESIKIYGMDVFYLPRTINNRDTLFGSDDSSSYDASYSIEMYIRNVNGFAGEGDLLSKFGLEIRDQITFTVARRTFSSAVGDQEDQIRPNEGDLIFFPLNNKIFRINFVEHEAIFYQMGSLQTYDLRCELFEYSGETFNTGIPQIDDLVTDYDMNISGDGLRTEDNLFAIADEENCLPIMFEDYVSAIDEKIKSENEYYQQQGYQIIDFSEYDPFAEGTY